MPPRGRVAAVRYASSWQIGNMDERLAAQERCANPILGPTDRRGCAQQFGKASGTPRIATAWKYSPS